MAHILLLPPRTTGTTVSKSFARSNANGDPIAGVDTINISIASYRVVESKKHGKYAQFLVIYREGSIRDTIGIWKRYRDFEELAHKVTHSHESCAVALANISPLAVAEEPETEHLPNAITSWRLLKKRQRWYRCLDAGYLSLKVSSVDFGFVVASLESFCRLHLVCFFSCICCRFFCWNVFCTIFYLKVPVPICSATLLECRMIF